MFDSIFGLPVHPLLVHAPLVLLPLVVAGLIALAFKPAWRPRYASLALTVLVIAAMGTLGAVVSGLALAERVELPEQHRLFGISTAVAAGILLAVGGMWLWRVRQATERTKPDDTMGWVVSALGVIVVVLVALTGHSGATAVWGDIIAGDAALPAASGGVSTPSATSEASTPTSAAATPGESASGGPSSEAPSTEPSAVVSSPAEGEPGAITMAEVEANNTGESCWATINGTVYDLTPWIAQHPGGSDRILALCGTDATAAFTGQHKGDDEPQERLRGFEIGPLA